MLDETSFTAFRDIGRDLFLRGLISSHAGNMSVRTAQGICITRSRSMLGRMVREDLLEVDLRGPGPSDGRASSELMVHRAIYAATDARAVLHVHPPHATLLSMLQDELIPVDWEGRALLQRVPVVDMGLTSDGALLKSAFGLVDALKASKVVMVRGHGSFARGESMEEVYMLTTSLEASSFYIYHLRGQDKAKSFS